MPDGEGKINVKLENNLKCNEMNQDTLENKVKNEKQHRKYKKDV